MKQDKRYAYGTYNSFDEYPQSAIRPETFGQADFLKLSF